MTKQINIDPLSVVPLFLECYAGETELGTGTGFVVQKNNNSYLVTNWHVLSGRDPTSGNPLSSSGLMPDKLAVWHHIKSRLGSWSRKFIPLKKPDGSKVWKELPQAKKFIDVVSLPLAIDDEVQLYPLDLSLANTDLILAPSEPVSIVGFPLGLSSGGKFPIWKTGHIASDIDLDYDTLPVFLIDATTKSGMSGSPVIARRTGMVKTSKSINMGGEATRFLGVYSGRIHNQADVGMVWKPELISSLIE